MLLPKPPKKKGRHKKPTESIIQSEKRCYKSGKTEETNKLFEHHIFGGTANRKNSEKYGLKVWLIREWHTDSPNGVHHNAELMQQLHEVGQRAFEEKHGTRADFIRIFGRNYLDDDPAWEFDKK